MLNYVLTEFMTDKIAYQPSRDGGRSVRVDSIDSPGTNNPDLEYGEHCLELNPVSQPVFPSSTANKFNPV